MSRRPGLAASIGLAACSLACGAGPAEASGHTTDQRLSCEVQDVRGYYKFSRQKPVLGGRESLQVRVNAKDQQAEVAVEEASQVVPVTFGNNTIAMTIQQKGIRERLSIDAKAMSITIVSESSRQRLMKSGPCKQLAV